MSTRTRGVVIALTCMACASAAAAQSPRDAQPLVLVLRQEARRPQQQQQQRPQGAQRPQRAPRRGVEPAETTATFSHTAQLRPGATFELRNMTAGTVTINGGSGRDVSIAAVKRVRNAGAQAQFVLDAIRIDVAERGGNVEVLTVLPRVNAGRANQTNRPIVAVDYDVILPPNANVVLRTGSGTVRMQNVTGDVFDLNTLSGDLIMQALRGRLLDLHTVAGNMLLQDIAAERALLQSMNGDLEYIGRLAPTVKLRTHGGNIRLTPRPTAGFDIDATTLRGAIRSDYERPAPPAPNRAPQRPRTLRLTFGDGSAAVTAQSFSGNIFIVKPQD